MAELKAAVANMGEETVGVGGNEVMELKDKIEEFIHGKDRSTPIDLPQDYLPFSPAAAGSIESDRENPSKDSPPGSCSAANVHTWVSPNKSDEVPSSKESSPDDHREQTALREKEKSKGSTSSINVDLDAEYEADFEPIALEAKPELDLSIVGDSLEIQNSEVLSVADNEAVLSGSSKDFVKIIHGNKEVMLVLPSEVSCELGSTLEISEILAESLGIRDEIIGLKTSAMAIDNDEVSTHHGDVVIPFSSLASGQLRRLIKNAEGMERIPSFNLVTSSFDAYLEDYHVASANVKSEESSFQGEESRSVSVREGALYTEAFLEMMENSKDPFAGEFDPFEKNSLLRFGIDNAEQGNVLFRAAYRIAVYTGDMKYFVRGLKNIAAILLDDKSSPSVSKSDDGNVTDTNQSSMTIFGLTDFVIAADELFESSDLTAQQYITLLDAFFSGHSSVQTLFDLYHNPDFLLACDSDADLVASLCLRDLLHLGTKLELLQPNSQDDAHLKWAIKTGIHNFATKMSTELPQEFVQIIYHMFSSGDEMVLAACQQFLDTTDSDIIEEMLLREWDIFCRNKAFREEVFDNASPQYTAPVMPHESSSVKATGGYKDGDFPDGLLTAVACLVDQQEISEDSAAALLAKYAQGNRMLSDVYDNFIEFGGVDDFLDMVSVMLFTQFCFATHDCLTA